MPQLSIIIVSYNTASVTIQCIESILAAQKLHPLLNGREIFEHLHLWDTHNKEYVKGTHKSECIHDGVLLLPLSLS